MRDNTTLAVPELPRSHQLRPVLTALVVLAAVLTAAVPAGAAAPAGPLISPRSAPAQDTSARDLCGKAAGRPSRPASLAIPRVVDRRKVLALGSDRDGAPRTPPLTARGRWQLGWDRQVRVGARHGVVRLTAHTYPRSGQYGLALGNRLLQRLRVDHRIVVTDRAGNRSCYRVTRRVTVRAERSVIAYYRPSGPPRLAILVCSGVRRGPGDWSHRTIWFATPAPGAR